MGAEPTTKDISNVVGMAEEGPPNVYDSTSGLAKPRSFHGTAEIAAATAKMRLVQLTVEIKGTAAECESRVMAGLKFKV